MALKRFLVNFGAGFRSSNMSVSLKLGKGWKGFGTAISVKFHKATLEKHVGRATRANAVAVRRRVRQRIKNGNFEENAPLTTLFKGGASKPLKGTKGADLFNSIIYQVENWATAIVGVNRYNNDGVNLGLVVHEGTIIFVTDKMRNLFYLLWLVKVGSVESSVLTGRAKEIYDATKGAQGIVPIERGTNYIRIPPRPFFTDTLKDPETISVVRTNWQKAVEATISDQAKRGRRI